MNSNRVYVLQLCHVLFKMMCSGNHIILCAKSSIKVHCHEKSSRKCRHIYKVVMECYTSTEYNQGASEAKIVFCSRHRNTHLQFSYHFG